MLLQDPFPTDATPAVRKLHAVPPLRERERSLPAIRLDDDESLAADEKAFLEADPHSRTWALGLACEVFFRANAPAVAAVAARKARIAAGRCCGYCVAWTSVLEDRANEALAKDIGRRAWDLSTGANQSIPEPG